MTYKDWLKKKMFGTLGLVDSQTNPDSPRNTFINDPVTIQQMKIREYNVWYAGDSDELLNFYTRNNIIDYNYEPFFDRNKQSYFWAVSSTEGDVKRTHSGQARNIVDTMVNIVGLPKFTVGDGNSGMLSDKLKKILKENRFNKMFLQQQLPMTLVEGYGCYKINWDKEIRKTPILNYYKANNVEFIYRANVVVAIIFKDYYLDENGKKYLLIETRRQSKKDGSPCLIIEKELFRAGDGDSGVSESLVPISLAELPQLKDLEKSICVTNYDGFLAVPCIIYEDNETDNYGRSIFTGKIDLFDDLDQCLSQAANTVRRSTTREYFNSNYLERDPETGMPIQPKAFDRKYVLFQGGKSADGSLTGDPITVTQPAVNFQEYDIEATSIMLQIINGIMSPATLGIDIAKKDNAEAQREKEKVTIFTRNTIIEEEIEMLEKLGKELLCAQELMDTNHITAKDYDVAVKFDELADASFESKLDTLLTAFNADVMTPEIFVERLYGSTLSEEEKQAQIKYIKDRQEAASSFQAAMGGFGAMGADNAYNQAMANPGPDPLGGLGGMM